MSETEQDPVFIKNQDSLVVSARKKLNTLRSVRQEGKLLIPSLNESKRNVPKEVQSAYSQYGDVIRSIYGDKHLQADLLHHGTGAKKYELDDLSGTPTGLIARPLDTVLVDGLKPHLDQIGIRKPMVSTSLAYSWEYAKWFATMQQDPNEPLRWEYGDRDAWGSFFRFKNYTDASNLRHIAPMAKRMVSERLIKKIDNKQSDFPASHKWISATTSQVPPEATGMEILKAKTDLPGNFGAVITIDGNSVNANSGWGFGDAYEARTFEDIEPGNFVALAVPLRQVDTYMDVVQDLNYKFPVLPLEAVDLHMSRFALEEVAQKTHYNW